MKMVIIGANSYIARNMIFVLRRKYPDISLKLYDCGDEQVDGETNYEKINVLDADSVNSVDLNCDAVFMFVGKTGTGNGFDIYDSFIDINEKALLNLLSAMRNQKSPAKLIFPSTRLVYKGAKGALPEDAEKEFKTVYAINKFACEQYIEQFHNVFGINYAIFRICVPYGTLIDNASSYGTAEFMINKAKSGENISLYGDGSVRRTLVYMGDLCNALIEGTINDDVKNDVYNIGGEDYSLSEMAALIAVRYGVGIDYVPYPELAYKIESGDTVFDDSKLQKLCRIQYEMKFDKWCEKYLLFLRRL